MQLFKVTKWYFRPKWRFNIWSDFLRRTKRQKFPLKDKILKINIIQKFSKSSKKHVGRNFSVEFCIRIIYWLLISYSRIYHFCPQTLKKIHSLLSSYSDTLLKQRIIHFLTFRPKLAVFFFASRCFYFFSALPSNFQRTVREFLLRCK